MDSTEKTPWEKYKERMGEARPWHLLDLENRVSKEIQEERFTICKSCPRYVPLTSQCRECGCVMRAKTWLPNADCPLHKWGQAPKATT